MKTNELIKLLKKSKQCFLVRHGTNHDISYSNLTQKHFQVPRHKSKEIPTGTANKILDDAGLRQGGIYG